jgi:hypothetical protein
MLVLLGATSIVLTALQASINGPTDAFRGCLKEATAKATKEKVSPDGIEDYYRTNCSVQMESLKSAVIAFRVKNGMAKKAAADDATMTVEDYMAAPVDRYKFMADMDKGAPPAQAAAATPDQPKQ